MTTERYTIQTRREGDDNWTTSQATYQRHEDARAEALDAIDRMPHPGGGHARVLQGMTVIDSFSAVP